ncbi:PEP-CTERM sorting domain-containing protein [Phycisphaerales bacterium AB-hyl4]|uniref:PEP-CTERM sorting domain-containing protein n=1 Tax=Natronomicrosphaera hydrolytica TaxID=3242702 RepID=A0ABV4U458_9BACT
MFIHLLKEDGMTRAMLLALVLCTLMIASPALADVKTYRYGTGSQAGVNWWDTGHWSADGLGPNWENYWQANLHGVGFRARAPQSIGQGQGEWHIFVTWDTRDVDHYITGLTFDWSQTSGSRSLDTIWHDVFINGNFDEPVWSNQDTVRSASGSGAVSFNVSERIESISLSVSSSSTDSWIGDWYGEFTNAQITTTLIPEPASLGLLAVGGMVMLGGRRRRQR